MGWPQSWSGYFGEEKHLLPLSPVHSSHYSEYTTRAPHEYNALLFACNDCIRLNGCSEVLLIKDVQKLVQKRSLSMDL